MLNVDLESLPIGPNGEFGTTKIAIVDGKLVASQSLSLKAVLDSLAKKIGGPVPAEVAQFLETTIGLA